MDPKCLRRTVETLEARIAPAFAGVLSLGSLDGTLGFELKGASAGEYSGASVSDAGDINGDGFSDVIIGADRADGPNFGSGVSYVVFGKSSGFEAELDLSALDGRNGFRIGGSASSSSFGYSVSSAGDFNGDGFADLIIGARSDDTKVNAAGAAYVIFGKASSFTAVLSVATLAGTNGFKISGIATGDRAGYAVSSAGDVNNDGFDDVIVGAPQVITNDLITGVSYVVFGRDREIPANVDVSTLNGSNGFRIAGVAQFDKSGSSVGSAGDINGDGFADLIIGAYRAPGNGALSGVSYIVFGKAEGFAANVDLSALDGTNGFKLRGVASGDFSGNSVSGAGDINGDGFSDLIIGAPFASPNGRDSGAAYVVFGKATAFAPDLQLSSLDGFNGFRLSGALGDRAGLSVSGAGDVNGDGFDDVVVGALERGANSTYAGASFVVFGKESGFTPSMNLSTLNGLNGVKLTGIMRGDLAGESVSGAGDFNGDGLNDLIIGSSFSDANGQNSGTSYIVFGQRSLTVGIHDAVVAEGDSGTKTLEFVVSLSEPSATPVSVKVATQSDSAQAGIDFIGIALPDLTFAPGETTKIVTVEVLGDVLFEGEERFSVVLSDAAGMVIRKSHGLATITDDDVMPTVNIAGQSILEGNSGSSEMVFTVSLSAASGLPVHVTLAGTDGTALAGVDYLPITSTTLTFLPGETEKSIDIDVLGNARIESHKEFTISITEASGATIGESLAPGLILNDDTALRVSGVAGHLEGDIDSSEVVYTISLEMPSALPVTVSYATAADSAVAGEDFVSTSGELTFPPGETTRTVTVAVLGDTNIEVHEAFSIVLSDAINSEVAASMVTTTILNDDASIVVNDATVLEGHVGSRFLTFKVSLSAESALPVAVSYSVLDGTATAGADYITLPLGTFTFAPGEIEKVFDIEVLSDVSAEPSETFSVALSSAVNALIEKSTGVGMILDDDVVLSGKRTAHYIDPEGDLITINVSKGTLKVEDFTLFPSGLGSQLALVDFSGDHEFAGANLSITAKAAPGAISGTRSVDVGYINAAGIDLGKVRIEGDIGRIDAGDEANPRAAILSLNASSLGVRELATQLPGGSVHSEIAGRLGKVKFDGGMYNSTLSASGDITSVKVQGNVLGGTVHSDGRIRSLMIAGDLLATETNPAQISARGLLAPVMQTKALAIGSLSVAGSVEDAEILAGYGENGSAVNGSASIGKVRVGGNWLASSLAAGTAAGEDSFFGTEDDTPISGEQAVLSRIASIVIKGTASGTEASSAQFGFVAAQIGSFKAAGVKHALTPGPGNDLAGILVGSSENLRVREVV